MEEIKTDVLVIGGGIAGLWSALKAKEKVEDVCVVDKGFVGKTSNSAISAAAIIVVRPEDDFQACVKDLIRAQDGFIDRAMAEYILGNSYDRVKEMESWGADYVKKGGGYDTQASRGAHYLRTFFPAVQPGGVLLAVIKEARHRGIKILNRIYITGLLKDGARVTGAMGIEARTGEVYLIRSKATVIATNTAGFRGSHLGSDLSGDGPALAFRAGAEVVNAEFNSVNTAPIAVHFEGTGPLAASGARFTNAENEAFMARYYPEDKDRVDVGYLTKAMAMEVREGRGPVYLDFSAVGDDYWNRVWTHKSDLRLHRARLEKWGIEFLKPEWVPVHSSGLGAIRVDFNGASNVPGLFAAGKCRGGIGISLMTGWSWCSCVASGFLAGQAAGDYAGEVGYGRTGKKQVEALSKSIFEPMTRMGFETSDAVLKEIQETVFPYDIMILKHEKRLRKALDRIRRIYDEQAPEMTASDVHELVRVKETESILLNAEMFLLSSIKRTESRHGHFREDFPERDDTNWLKMVALSRNSEGAIDINTVTL